MKELINIKTMSSREIAELTGKRHDNVLRDCDVLNENYEKLSLLKIEETSYVADNGQTYREYLLTRMQTLDLMTGYNIELRIKVNRRWEELEQNKSFEIPQSFSEALMLAARQAEQIELQNKTIMVQAPKVEYYDTVLQSQALIPTTSIAKELGMSATTLNRLLHESGVQYRMGNQWVLYSKYQNLGYTGSKTTIYKDSLGREQTQVHTYWTEKGRKFILSLNCIKIK